MLSMQAKSHDLDHACSKEHEQEALSLAPTIRDWDALYSAFMHYQACDDGAIGEGFSESVARILVDKRESIGRLARIAKGNPKFLRFVYRHIDASLDPKDLQHIHDDFVKYGCGSLSQSSCKKIRATVNDALKDIKSPPTE